MTGASPEQQRMKERLEHQERVLELVQVGSWEWDLMRDHTFWSKGLYKILGVDPAGHEPTLQGFLSTVHPEDQQRVASLVSRAVDSRAPLDYEFRILRPDGEVRTLEAKASPVLDPQEGRLVRYVGTVRDITRTRALEEELRSAERMASVGMLASGIAHQFNNLFTAIRGHLSFLRADLSEAERYEEDLEGMAQTVDRAVVLVNELLAFGGQQIRPQEAIDVNSAVGQLEPAVRQLTGEAVKVIFELNAGVGKAMIGPNQIKRAILTLVEAADGAMPEGGVLTLRTDTAAAASRRAPSSPPSEVPPPYVRLTIEDTGAGIEGENLKHLFDPFFRAEGWNEELDIGLATVYGIVKGCDGSIDVHSVPGEGSRFDLYFPRANKPPEPSEDQP